MFEALFDAGIDITEEGVRTLFAMIDEDGNGKNKGNDLFIGKCYVLQCVASDSCSSSPHSTAMQPYLSDDIGADEWRETIEFYVELKEEEAEMHNQQAEQAEFMRQLKAKKMEALHQSMNNLGKKREGLDKRRSLARLEQIGASCRRVTASSHR